MKKTGWIILFFFLPEEAATDHSTAQAKDKQPTLVTFHRNDLYLSHFIHEKYVTHVSLLNHWDQPDCLHFLLIFALYRLNLLS